MNKKIIMFLFIIAFMSLNLAVFAYDSNELNKRLLSCKPTKDFHAGGSTLYQISGLTDSICIFKIQYGATSNKPDLICKVPHSKMCEMISFNPLTVQNAKKKYCVISFKKQSSTQKKIYY